MLFCQRVRGFASLSLVAVACRTSPHPGRRLVSVGSQVSKTILIRDSSYEDRDRSTGSRSTRLPKPLQSDARPDNYTRLQASYDVRSNCDESSRTAASRRRRIVLASVLALAVAVAIAAISAATGTTTKGRATTATTSTLSRHALGPDGVTSSAIIDQNRLAGTSSWKIGSSVSSTVVQGFANLTYAKVGQNVDLYVDSHAASYRAIAYRMGYYHGLGAHEVWRSPVERGIVQPACTVAKATNMVSCANWHKSLVMPITSAFYPGDYLIKLVAGPRAASYVLLTVWDPSSTAAYVIMNRSLVEQGWNTYGGYSYYSGEGACILDDYSYPPCNRARVVSFDRPYDTGDGSSDFLTNEYPLIRLVEKEGLDVTYISDITLSEHPNAPLAPQGAADARSRRDLDVLRTRGGRACRRSRRQRRVLRRGRDGAPRATTVITARSRS